MIATLKLSYSLSMGWFRAYTLVILGLASMGIFANFLDERPYGPWLIWSLAIGLVAAMIGSLGAELRLISGARLYRMLPGARLRLAASVLILMCLAVLPATATVLLAPLPMALVGLGLALALLFLAAGMWLGINGPMYLGLAILFLGPLSGNGTLGLPSSRDLAILTLLLGGGLTALAWIRFFGARQNRDTNVSFRSWIWHRPDRAISWRMLSVHAAITLLFVIIIALPQADALRGLSENTAELRNLYAGVAFAMTIMIALTTLNEAVLYRQRMRQLLMFPGWDRGRLHAAMETGLLRLILTLGVLPLALTTAVMVLAGQWTPVMLFLAVMAIIMHCLVGWAALAVAASPNGGVVLSATCIAIIGTLVLLVTFNLVLEADAWPAWAWAWLAASATAAAVLRFYARSRWLRLSLESIDHWLAVRLAHQQWRADL
ncbi:MAG: hypothetical protein LAT56_07775 [Wenzhouxiangella sp.]|nr:hypothetical protein [Wenzhouxiangella sp.]